MQLKIFCLLLFYFSEIFHLIQVTGFDVVAEETERRDVSAIQRGRTRRTVWLDRKRRLILPPDTSLSITPILAFPLFKQSSAWVAFENLQIQWTFLILFQGLGWTSEENAWPLDVSFLIPNVTKSKGDGEGNEESENESNGDNTKRKGQPRPQSSSYNLVTNMNKWGYPQNRCGRSIPVMALPTYIPGGERATLFPRIEKFLSSFGINGRACLKRAVCEVQEIPLKNGFGMLGEVLTLFLSVSHSPYAKSLLPGYLRAEMAGKLGDCSMYYNKCPFSMFTSK